MAFQAKFGRSAWLGHGLAVPSRPLNLVLSRPADSLPHEPFILLDCEMAAHAREKMWMRRTFPSLPRKACRTCVFRGPHRVFPPSEAALSITGFYPGLCFRSLAVDSFRHSAYMMILGFECHSHLVSEPWQSSLPTEEACDMSFSEEESLSAGMADFLIII